MPSGRTARHSTRGVATGGGAFPCPGVAAVQWGVSHVSLLLALSSGTLYVSSVVPLGVPGTSLGILCRALGRPRRLRLGVPAYVVVVPGVTRSPPGYKAGGLDSPGHASVGGPVPLASPRATLEPAQGALGHAWRLGRTPAQRARGRWAGWAGQGNPEPPPPRACRLGGRGDGHPEPHPQACRPVGGDGRPLPAWQGVSLLGAGGVVPPRSDPEPRGSRVPGGPAPAPGGGSGHQPCPAEGRG